jgi:fluoride exporter
VKGVLWVGLGGFVGANARYLFATWIAGRAGPLSRSGPWSSTSRAASSWALLLGVLENHVTPPALRLALAIGFVGAYTTFSTFTYETIRLIEEGSFLLAALNAGGSLALGLGAVVGRLGLGRSL